MADNNLYGKFAQLFPEFANGKYSYLRLESKGYEPLSLEWVSDNCIVVMHTYTLNGDLCYDPLMEFRFNNIGKGMSASTYEQSIPPLRQFFDCDGVGKSVNKNGEETTITTLQSKLDSFASQWFDNISAQGYMPVKGNLVISEYEEKEIIFGRDGKPSFPETVDWQKLESDFLETSVNMFSIYQVRDDIENVRGIRFASFKEIEKNEIKPNIDNYNLVYVAPFGDRVEFLSDRQPILNKLFEQFNTDHPKDYTGRSMSVSDVVVLRYNGDMSVHYVDSLGFVEIDKSDFYGSNHRLC